MTNVVINKHIQWTSDLVGYDVSSSLVFTSESADGLPLGSITLHNYRPGCNVELGIVTTKRGLTRKLIATVAAYIFGQLRLPRCSIVVHANDASQLRIVERLGFTHEGYFKDWYGPGAAGIQYKLTLNQLQSSKFGILLRGDKS